MHSSLGFYTRNFASLVLLESKVQTGLLGIPPESVFRHFMILATNKDIIARPPYHWVAHNILLWLLCLVLCLPLQHLA
ncbi:hypothetical protein [Helicobacter sp. 16-1353]|uniref:hypothetical protein n=1 Tax=Helicobacter sp. 16-1353 TaxID=2004996 RepID=UPI0011BE6C83|nr:hypothetical protein [Helicobacter sp. 16-1353]